MKNGMILKILVGLSALLMVTMEAAAQDAAPVDTSSSLVVPAATSGGAVSPAAPPATSIGGVMAPSVISLADAFRLVEGQNFQVEQSLQEIAAARQRSIADRSALFPQVGIDVIQTRSLYSNIGRGIGDFPSLPPQNRFDAKLSASVPLINATALATWRLAEFTEDITELNHEMILQEAFNQVASAYFTHLRNLARLSVIDANIERDRVLLDLSSSQFQAGVATPLDVTRAEVRLAGDRRDRLQQETLVVQSDLQLKALLNLDLDASLTLEEERRGAILEATPARPNLDQGSILEVENRPEYQVAARQLERNRFARKAALWQHLPTLEAFGEWGRASEEFSDSQREKAWAAGIQLSIPLFTGLRIRANREEAEAAIRQQEAALAEIEKQIGADYRLARQDVRSRRAQIAISREKLDLSNRELDQARTRFTQGVADNSDVVTAQANVAAAHDELVESIYQFNLSLVTFARVLGEVRDLVE